jgi:hypothetical protein
VERTCDVFQKAVGRSDPKIALSIFCEATRIVACERWIVLLIEDGELNAIEAGNASFGSDPEVSVVSLEDLVNTILRKAVLA